MKKYTLNDQEFPVVLSPSEENFDLIDWASNSRDYIRELLNKHGAILFRNFDVDTIEAFEEFSAKATSDNWVEYREAATPRSHVNGNVFTSTEYPASETIFFHNENSHTTTWPLYLCFYCKTPAETGGETPLADCRKIYSDIPLELRNEFEAKNVMYSRSFGYGLGIPWKKGFPVNSQQEMVDYCHLHDMQPVWGRGEQLNLRYTRWASLDHPVTQDKVWFNHATFFNFYSLNPDTRSLIEQHIGQQHAPYNTYYGDGSEITQESIELLRSLYQKHSIKIPYQKNDVLLIDNMLVAHGRMPFTGTREVFVTMNHLLSKDQFKLNN